MNSPSMETKRTQSLIVFVCEHGAAKSVIAAAYFNKFADEMGLDMRAIARGTNPENELSPQTVKGLLIDGLTPTELFPRKLTRAEAQSAKRLITFCELPHEHQQQAIIQRWNDIPPVSENYEKARDMIIDYLDHLIRQLK